LDDFLDLIVWGHEHDCLVDPLYYPQRDFYVSQPGSSTVTSLSEGEAINKHIALLLVKGHQFELCPLPLRSCRPFQFADLVLTAQDDDIKLVQQKITNTVTSMIEVANEKWRENNTDNSATTTTTTAPLPLIRLRIDYTQSPALNKQGTINPHRFGQSFADRVANPRDILLFIRKRATRLSPRDPHNPTTNTINIPSVNQNEIVKVEDLVSEFLSHQRLDLLPQNEFSDIVKIFVEKDDKDAIDVFLKTCLQRTIGQLKEKQTLESLRTEIERVRLSREEEWRTLNPTAEAAVCNHRKVTSVGGGDECSAEASLDDRHDDENIDDQVLSVASSSIGKTTRTPATPRGRAKRPTPLQLSTPTSINNSMPNSGVDPKDKDPPVKRSRWPTKK
jgi:double-strand break repair protein MRE11